MRRICLTVNGQEHEVAVESNETLVDVLRQRLGLTGTKKGCGAGDCGACTVLLDGRAVNSCLILACQAVGHAIETIEGLGGPEALHPLQQAFVEAGAIQCGYCTPGMILASKSLLDRNSTPTEREIRVALSGNLCRCTGYQKIFEAVQSAADAMRSGASPTLARGDAS